MKKSTLNRSLFKCAIGVSVVLALIVLMLGVIEEVSAVPTKDPLETFGGITIADNNKMPVLESDERRRMKREDSDSGSKPEYSQRVNWERKKGSHQYGTGWASKYTPPPRDGKDVKARLQRRFKEQYGGDSSKQNSDGTQTGGEGGSGTGSSNN